MGKFTPTALIRPILECLSEASSYMSNQEIGKKVAGLLNLSKEEVEEMSAPLRGKTRFKANLDSTLITLKGASLLEGPYGKNGITAEGKEFLHSRAGKKITRREVVALWEQQRDGKENSSASVTDEEKDDEKIPEEQIADAYNQWRDELASDLRSRIKGIKPKDFEKLVAELLVKMGYGRGEVVGGSSDGGVDAIMTQDRLGLEKVYIQIKHWNKKISPKAIREFNGVLSELGKPKGVFVTSSTFTKNAKEEAAINLELIDGPKLIDLMIEYDLGLIKKATYEILEVDENFRLFKQD